MKTIVFFLKILFLGFFGIFSAQNVIPKMKIENKRANPMQLQELKTDIFIIGNTAVTTMEMVFYNPNSRVMEGSFEFPLSDNYRISRFALDIDGKLREGVVVDKTKGRKAFEDIVRRGIDPGLLEKTEGNNFRARVYPFPAKGTRKILIAFEQELGRKNGKEFYFLPIKNELKLKKFSLKAEIVAKKVKIEGENSLGLDFKDWRNSYITEIEKKDFTISENISLSFPKVEKQQIFTAKNEKQAYFYGVFPEIYFKKSQKEKTLPKKIGLIWDNSSSGKNRNFDKEISLLDSYFQKIKNAEIQLQIFNIRQEKLKNFAIKNGNWDELKNELKNNIIYDGGTDISAVNFENNVDEYLFFTDGIFNFGKEISVEKIAEKIKKPLYAINSNLTANTNKIKFLAYQTGGNFIDLTSENQGAELLTQMPLRLIDIKIKNGKVQNIFPKKGYVLSQKPFVFSGEILSENATLEFSFGYGNQITERQEVTFENDSKENSDFQLFRRIWAGKKIEQMQLENAPQKEIDKVGQEFGIVTEGTSLIVLENVEDYVNYEITPPKELENKYFKLLAQKQKVEAEAKKNKNLEKKSHLEQVIKESEYQTEWWKTNYPLPVAKKEKKVVRTGARSQRVAPPASPEALLEEVAVLSDAVAAAPMAAAKEVSAGAERNSQPVGNQGIKIQLGQWNPDTPYAKVLEYAEESKAYETYLKLREEYGDKPSFYTDAADYFFKKGKKDLAVKVLSNLAEMNLEEPQLLRILGYKLTEYERADLAVEVFRKVLKIRGEEPQSYRDLGLALNQNKEYDEAVKMLYKVVEESWNHRFNGISLIAMNEINQIVNAQKGVNTSFIEKKLLKKEPVDIRVVLTWDTDASDMDLHIIDPENEEVSFRNRLSRLGGKISNDMTGGYGPEEFMMKKAVKGKYKIKANYFGNHSQKQLFPVSLKIEFFTHYGSENQEKKEVVVRLSNQSEMIEVGEFGY